MRRIINNIPGGSLRMSNDDFSVDTNVRGGEPALVVGHNKSGRHVLRVLLGGIVYNLHQTWLEDGLQTWLEGRE